MKPITNRKAISSFVLLVAVAGTGTLSAQTDKPAAGGMMHGSPGAMGHGGSEDRMNMMQMMSQMSQMMESCNKMMQSTAVNPRKEPQLGDRKEQ